MEILLEMVSSGLLFLLNNALFLIGMMFYVVTNIAPSSDHVTENYRRSINSHKERTVFVAELIGTAIRCAMVVGVFFLMERFPHLKFFAGLLLCIFAIMITYGRHFESWGSPSKMYSGTHAITGIASATVICNVDNIIATTVDGDANLLVSSMLFFMVLYVLFKGTGLGDKGLSFLIHVIGKFGHPRTWWIRLNWKYRVILIVLAVIPVVFLISILPLAYRSIKGISRVVDDGEELATGVWVFILIMFSVVFFANSPWGKSVSTPLCLWCVSLVQEFFYTTIDLDMMRIIVRWSAGSIIAMLLAWWYAPVIEKRVADNLERKRSRRQLRSTVVHIQERGTA